MAVDTSLSGLLEEIQFAKAHVKPYLASFREERMQFTGPGYKEGQGRTSPENHPLSWIALMRGQLLMGNPQVLLTSMMDGDPQARAAALTMAVNAVSRRLQLKNVNEQLLMDFGFKWAVCLVRNGPPPGFTDLRSTKKWPGVYRISPEKFLYDPAADRLESREWSAHLVIASRKDLIERSADKSSGWNREALEDFESSNVKEFRGKEKLTPDRDEIAYWEIWYAAEDHEKSPGRDKGYHGQTFTVADGQSSEDGWLRDPFPAFVPPWGPYCVGGDYLVPDESAPMGSLTASSQQAAFVNRTKRATIEAIEAYKRLIFVKDPKVAEAIKNGNMDWVYTLEVEDLRNAVVVSEMGGATQQHFAAEESAQAALERVSGITDLMKGKVDPRNKATQDALAAQASGNKVSGTVAKFYDLVSRYLMTVAYFIDIDDEVEIELGPQAAGRFVDKHGKPTTRVSGGRHPTQDPEEFFNLQLELKVGSMERSLEMDTQMQLQVMRQVMQDVMTMGVATAAYSDWQGYLDATAELTGIPIIKRMINVPALTAVSQAMIQAGMAQPAGAQGQSGGHGVGQPKPMYAGNPSPGSKLPAQMAARAGKPSSGSEGAARTLSARKPALDAKPGGG